MAPRQYITAFVSGLIFALGLGIAGMTRPEKIIAFLDISGARGAWDPSLALVMVGAIAMYFTLYRLSVRRTAPVFAAALQLPTRKDINARLVLGALLFGIGWGLIGLCPGPALTVATTGNGVVLAFVAAMLGGMVLYSIVDGRLASR